MFTFQNLTKSGPLWSQPDHEPVLLDPLHLWQLHPPQRLPCHCRGQPCWWRIRRGKNIQESFQVLKSINNQQVTKEGDGEEMMPPEEGEEEEEGGNENGEIEEDCRSDVGSGSMKVRGNQMEIFLLNMLSRRARVGALK